jgi:signal transduction histidine kinase
LNRSVGEVVELLRGQAEEQGVELLWEPDERVGELRYDQEGIHRAVLNVVTNALEACVEVRDARVRVGTEWDGVRRRARVVVSDNGPGVPAGKEEGIFELFHSSKGSRGTGLGLPVSRKIAREHGGDLVLERGTGGGARFVLELPWGELGGGTEGAGTDERPARVTAESR